MITVEGPPGAKRRKRKTPRRRKTPARERKRRGLVFTIVVGSIIAHAVALALFGLFIVAEYFREPEATFTVSRNIVIPAQTREHSMNMARHQAMAPKPSFTEKLVSIRPNDFALPDLPEVPLDQMLPLDPSELISDQVSSLVGTSGLGAGLGTGLQGGGGAGGGMSFFDIEDNAKSLVIMIDVSASMFGRTGDYDYSTSKLMRRGKEQSFQRIREEAFKLIDGLSINTRFGIIHWSGSARLWNETLVPATKQNKSAAKEHIQKKVDMNKAGPTGGRPGGTRHDYALEAVLELEPEIVFMLTDGNATRSFGRGKFENIEARELYKQLQEAKDDHPSIPRIHTIYYVTGKDKSDEERMLRGISRRTGGKFRKVKAERKPVAGKR